MVLPTTEIIEPKLGKTNYQDLRRNVLGVSLFLVLKKKAIVATTLSTLLVSTTILANAIKADEVETGAAVTVPSTEVVATEATTDETSTAAASPTTPAVVTNDSASDNNCSPH